MKFKNFLLLTLLLISFSFSLMAQTPEQFKYQAAARDASGAVLANQSVGLQISIRSGSATGTVEYQETHTATTNGFGLFSLNIGTGTATMGTFSGINWGSGMYFMQVELDPAGGTAYTDMGTTQLMSVPYALYAKNAENVDDADADATNELQTISKSGNTVTLSDNGGTFTDDVDDADADATNEIQTISKAGNTISLSNGGGSITDDVNDADADATNEIQTISKMGSTVTLSNGGGTFTDDVNDADADATNELQTISKSGSTVTLSNNGGTFTDDVNDADADATNEIQTLSLSGNQLSLSNNGGSVTLTGGPWNTSGNNIYYNAGKVGIGSPNPPNHLFGLGDGATNDVMVLTGANAWGHGARINFGDANYVQISEDRDDDMIIRADRVRMETDSLKIGYNYDMNGAQLTFRNSFRAYTYSGNTLYRGYEIQDAGIFTTYGPNTNLNTEIGALATNVNHGYIAVKDTGGVNQAGMFVNASGDGIIFGDQKNFRIPHPTQPGKEIWYGSLEGPELAAYIRGTADMVNGEVFVSFPEHYELVANPSTMTVILTPLSANSKGLAVVEKVANGFRIKELHGGTGTYQVDWEVKCVRKGKEGYRPVRDASEAKSLQEIGVETSEIPARPKVKNPAEK